MTNSKTDSIHLDKRRTAMLRPSRRRRHRLVLMAMTFALSGVIAIFIVGYIVAFVLPPRELVVRVDGVEYTRGDLVELVRIRQQSANFLGETFDASSGVFESLQLLVENEIVNQVAPSIGVAVSQEEVDNHVQEIMRPQDHEVLGKSEDQILRETKERYASYLNMIQITEDKHRQLVRNAALREKVRQYVGDAVPYVAEQVHLYRIVMPVGGEIDIMNIKFEDAVRDISDPLALHSAYLKVVREFSQDLPETVRRGGEIGWIASGVLPDYEYQFFDMVPGELSDPVKNRDNSNQVFFFMIGERHKAKELSPVVRDELKTKALVEWVNKERRKHDVYAVFNSEIYDWVFQQLRIASTAPAPTPDPMMGIMGGM